MSTTRAYITATEVSRAVQAVAPLVKKGKPVPAGMTVIADVHLKGLRLISVGGRVSWAMKTRTHTKTLGYAFPDDEWPLTAPEKARELGGRVKALLAATPEKVDGYLDNWHAGMSDEAALAALVEKPDTWTLRKCFEVTIEDKLHPDSLKKINQAHARDLKVTMKRPSFQKVLDMPASLVSPQDIEGVRDQIVRDAVAKGQKGVSPSIKFVTHVRSVLTYCAGHHRASGLNPERPWWQFVKPKFKNPKRERTPTIEDLVATLILAEEYLDKPLPGRAINTPGIGHGALAGLWWVVLTCQRIDAGLSLLAHDIVEDPERPGTGWMLAAWDSAQMKAGKSFVLPIPKRAWSHIDRFRKGGKSDEWAFPSDREPEKHVTASGAYRILYRLKGGDELIQKPKEEKPPRLRKDGKPWGRPQRTERRNLMEEAGIPWWSAHDDRRTLADFMTKKKMPGGASAILAHEVDEKEVLKITATDKQRMDFQRQRTAKITALAYGSEAQFIDLKSEAMLLWTDAVLDEYDRQRAEKAPNAGLAMG